MLVSCDHDQKSSLTTKDKQYFDEMADKQAPNNSTPPS